MVPDRLKEDTVTYKKLIAGVLVTLQKQVFEYLELLDGGKYTHAPVSYTHLRKIWVRIRVENP